MSAIEQLPQYIQMASPERRERLVAQLDALMSPMDKLRSRSIELLRHLVKGSEFKSSEGFALKVRVLGVSPELSTNLAQLADILPIYPAYTTERGTAAGLLRLLATLLPGFQFAIQERTFPRPEFRVNRQRLGTSVAGLQSPDGDADSAVIWIFGLASALTTETLESVQRILYSETPPGQRVFLRVARMPPEVPMAAQTWAQVGARL